MATLDTKPYRLAMVAYACHHGLAPAEKGFNPRAHGPLQKPGRAFLLRIQKHLIAAGDKTVKPSGLLDKQTRLALIPPPKVTLRDKIVANALWGVEHEPDIHYTEGGVRMSAVHLPRSLPMYADCSAAITCWYSWAGAPDPNGLSYNGYGYTGTLLLHGTQIRQADAQPADYVIFGPGTGAHVSLLVKRAPDPELVSHGREAGPRLQPLSYDNRQPQRWIRSIPPDKL